MSMKPIGDTGSKFVWDPRHQTDEEFTEELWDENIDYVLALQAICEAGSISSVQRIATNVLRKHGKKETL